MIYIINYFKGIVFNWIQIYLIDFIVNKNKKIKITNAAKKTIINIFINYNYFKNEIKKIFGNIDK